MGLKVIFCLLVCSYLNSYLHFPPIVEWLRVPIKKRDRQQTNRQTNLSLLISEDHSLRQTIFFRPDLSTSIPLPLPLRTRYTLNRPLVFPSGARRSLIILPSPLFLPSYTIDLSAATLLALFFFFFLLCCVVLLFFPLPLTDLSG